MDKDYLTIREYADIKGVSYHAIYKKLNTTLLPYVKEVKGHKVLKKEVLDDFVNPQNFNVKENLFNVKEKKFNPSDEGVEPSALGVEEELKRVNARNEELIDDLRAEIKAKDAQLQQMTEKIVDLFETNQRLMENNQKLQLNYQLLLGDGKNIDVDAEVEEQDARGQEKPEIQPEEKKKKKGFLSWLFGEN